MNRSIKQLVSDNPEKTIDQQFSSAPGATCGQFVHE